MNLCGCCNEYEKDKWWIGEPYEKRWKGMDRKNVCGEWWDG